MKLKKQDQVVPQQKITNFFMASPVSTKRKNESESEEERKRVKSGNEETPVDKESSTVANTAEATDSKQATAPLTPDQKWMINEKRIAASLKVVSNRTPIVDPNSIGHSWYSEILEKEFRKPYFQQLSDFYCSQRATIYPTKQNIFSWTRYCELRDVKVVIIGQDPYHGPNQAHGLCFSVQKGVATPPSLQNMYKELRDDPGVPEFTTIPNHGYLEGWAKQGVLLLNAVLTVEASKANSHKDKGWETLTGAVINWINANMNNVVFLLWGAFAQKVGGVVDKKRHSVLKCVHPSPLSAHRGFFGCKHFSLCNEELKKAGKTPINWAALP